MTETLPKNIWMDNESCVLDPTLYEHKPAESDFCPSTQYTNTNTLREAVEALKWKECDGANLLEVRYNNNALDRVLNIIGGEDE